jgi:adenine/guanine phosphoribosyltransferase-like PRPP-binding protein
MDSFNSVILNLIIVLTGLSTILVLMDALGFLPYRWARWLNKNRLSFSISLLKELGIKVENAKPTLDHFPGKNYAEEARKKIEKFSIDGPISVGKIERAKFDKYIDLSGATTDESEAVLFARFLATHLKKKEILYSSLFDEMKFDAVACPKTGSPFLAYEFAKMVGKPLFVHSAERKFDDAKSASAEMRACFDAPFVSLPDKAKFLIVDDSSTGGRKALALIQALRRFEYVIEDCLVVFEPLGKGARKKLEQVGVRLHTVIEGNGPKAV